MKMFLHFKSDVRSWKICWIKKNEKRRENNNNSNYCVHVNAQHNNIININKTLYQTKPTTKIETEAFSVYKKTKWEYLHTHNFFFNEFFTQNFVFVSCECVDVRWNSLQCCPHITNNIYKFNWIPCCLVKFDII